MNFCYANNIYGITLNKYFISKMAFRGLSFIYPYSICTDLLKDSIFKCLY